MSRVGFIVRDFLRFEFMGTLLQVTNLVPNALVNSSYNLMDPPFNPSNHLIAVGSRLDGKTLHMRVSVLE